MFYQVDEWKGLADDLVPSDWGWHLDDGMYIPMQTDQSAASSLILGYHMLLQKWTALVDVAYVRSINCMFTCSNEG